MIDETITFGLELECVRLTAPASSLMQQHGFTRHYDASIRDSNGGPLPSSIEDGGGSEIVTPVYKVGVKMDNEGKHVRLDYGTAQAAVKALCDSAAEINTSCGIHIHLGRPNGDNGKSEWKPEQIRTMLAICSMREEKFFQLVPPSRRNNRHAMPIKQLFNENDLQSFYPQGTPVPRKSDNPKRYCWLNLIETRRKGTDPRPGRMLSEATGTVEIRMLGNTRRFEYVWAWTQMWVKIAAYVAYLQPSFSLMHCVVTDSIATEIEAVNRAKNAVNGQEATVEQQPHVPNAETIHSRPIVRPPAPRPSTPIHAPAYVEDIIEPDSIPEIGTPISVRRRGVPAGRTTPSAQSAPPQRTTDSTTPNPR